MGTDMTQEQTTYSSDIQDCALRLLDTANDLSKIVQVHIPFLVFFTFSINFLSLKAESDSAEGTFIIICPPLKIFFIYLFFSSQTPTLA